MQKNKYQMEQIIELAVGTGVTALIAGLISYVLSSVSTQVSNANVTIINNLGTDTLKSLMQFLPVYVIGGIAIILIGMFLVGFTRRLSA